MLSNAECLQDPAIAVISREAAEEVSEAPGQNGRDQEQPDRPGEGAQDELRDRCREGGQRGPEIPDRYPLPEVDVLLEGPSFETVELTEGFPHHLDGFGARRCRTTSLPRSTARPD